MVSSTPPPLRTWPTAAIAKRAMVTRHARRRPRRTPRATPISARPTSTAPTPATGWTVNGETSSNSAFSRSGRTKTDTMLRIPNSSTKPAAKRRTRRRPTHSPNRRPAIGHVPPSGSDATTVGSTGTA